MQRDSVMLSVSVIFFTQCAQIKKILAMPSEVILPTKMGATALPHALLC